MPAEPNALLITLASALAWVGLDLLRKLLAAHGRAVPLTFLLVASQVPLFLVWTLLEGDFTVGRGYWLPGLGSMILNLLANLAYMQSVRLSPMSATLPLLALTPAFATLAGVPLLGEIPSPLQGVGIVIVVAGALLLNLEPRRGSALEGWWRRLGNEPGAPYMAFVALVWSVAPALDKIAVQHVSVPFHGLVLGLGIGCSLFLLLLHQGRVGELRLSRRAWGLLAIAGMVSVIALGLQLLALKLVWVGLIETVKRGVGTVMALVLAWTLLGEAFSGRRLLAVLIMVLGVWLCVATGPVGSG